MRRPILLLELLIGLTLTTLLITTLLTFTTRLAKFDQAFEAHFSQAQNLDRLQHRIKLILPSTSSRSQLGKTPLYTDKHALVTSYFDGGVDPDPRFSNQLYARINLEEKNLVLTIYPNTVEHVVARREVLFRGVESAYVEFFSGERGWRSEWPKQLPYAPPMIRVCFFANGQLHRLPFLLYSSQPEITYKIP
jgi:type II secretory pathway component PulJ